MHTVLSMQAVRHSVGLTTHTTHLAASCHAVLSTSTRLQSTAVSSSSTSGVKLSGDIKQLDDMPGPGGLPYFGTYFKYKLGTANIYKLFDTLKKWHGQYGPVFKEMCLGYTVIHVAEPDALRAVYAHDGKWPRVEPLSIPSMHFRRQKGISPGLGNSNNEEWYQLRRAAQQLMMRPKEVLPFLPTSDQVAIDFIAYLESICSTTKEVPDFATELGQWSLETFGVHCFSRRLGYLTEAGRKEAEDILSANLHQFELMTRLFACLPLYQKTGIITPKWKKLFAAEDFLYETFRKHFNRAAEDLREKMSQGELKDGDFRFLSFLMSKEDLSPNDVAIMVHSLFYDPLSTVKSQLQFLLYLLAINPRVQDLLYEEIQAVVPPFPSPLTPSMVRGLSYFRACFKESIRMMPIVNENTRFTGKDLVLGGYHVPANTLVHLNHHVLYRNPEYFSEPDVFLPERWLQEGEEELKADPIIVQPFSIGPRMCIGRRFAEQDMAVLVTRLLQRFRVEWHQPPMGVKFLTLNIPDCPARFTFHPR